MFLCLDTLAPALVVDTWLSIERLDLHPHEDSDFPSALQILVNALNEGQATLRAAGYELPGWVFNTKLISILSKRFPEFTTHRFPLEPTAVHNDDTACMDLSALQSVFLSMYQEQEQQRSRELDLKLREAESQIMAIFEQRETQLARRRLRKAQRRQKRKQKERQKQKQQEEKEPIEHLSEIVLNVKPEGGREGVEWDHHEEPATSLSLFLSSVCAGSPECTTQNIDDVRKEINMPPKPFSTDRTPGSSLTKDNDVSKLVTGFSEENDPWKMNFDEFLTPSEHPVTHSPLSEADLSL